MLARFHERFGVERTDKSLVPLVCWADGYVTGRLATAEELKGALLACIGRDCFWTEPLTEEEINAEKGRLENLVSLLMLPMVETLKHTLAQSR